MYLDLDHIQTCAAGFLFFIKDSKTEGLENHKQVKHHKRAQTMTKCTNQKSVQTPTDHQKSNNCILSKLDGFQKFKI